MMDGAQTAETERERGERDHRRKVRSIAIALALAGLAVMFYAATIVRMGAAIASHPQTTQPQ